VDALGSQFLMSGTPVHQSQQYEKYFVKEGERTLALGAKVSPLRHQQYRRIVAEELSP